MLPSMDFSVVIEYSKWLSFHLANTSLAWPYWDHWVKELKDEADEEIETSKLKDSDVTVADPGRSSFGYDSICGTFCRLIVDRLTRIFVPDIVRASLPPSIQSWVPSLDDSLAVSVDFGTVLTTSDHNSSESPADQCNVSWELVSVGQTLKTLMSARDENDSIESFLDKPNDILDSSVMVTPLFSRFVCDC